MKKSLTINSLKKIDGNIFCLSHWLRNQHLFKCWDNYSPYICLDSYLCLGKSHLLANANIILKFEECSIAFHVSRAINITVLRLKQILLDLLSTDPAMPSICSCIRGLRKEARWIFRSQCWMLQTKIAGSLPKVH